MSPGILLAVLGGAAALAASRQAAASSSAAPKSSGSSSSGAAGFDALFQKYAAQQSLNWKWLKAFCMNESSLGAAPSVARGLASPSDVLNSVSADGKSWGIMQLTLPTAGQFEDGTTPDLLNDPEISVRIAAKLVAWLAEQFDDSDPRFVEWVVKSYNQGVGNTKREVAGTGGGYADEYWTRWQRNFARL